MNRLRCYQWLHKILTRRWWWHRDSGRRRGDGVLHPHRCTHLWKPQSHPPIGMPWLAPPLREAHRCCHLRWHGCEAQMACKKNIYRNQLLLTLLWRIRFAYSKNFYSPCKIPITKFTTDCLFVAFQTNLLITKKINTLHHTQKKTLLHGQSRVQSKMGIAK